MKKIAKISLVAAVAVAGLTTANAQPLEQAINGVEVSGSVVYRYNDYNNDTNYATEGKSTDGSKDGGVINGKSEKNKGTNSYSDNNYKVGLNVAAPVNEFVKFNSRFLVADEKGEFAGTSTPNGGLDSQDNGDTNVDVELSNAYFGFTGFKNTTINAGKQGLTTPWTVATQIDGNEQTGTGLLALHTLNQNVTFAGAYFNQTNLGTSGNLAGILDAKKPTVGAGVSSLNDTVENWNSTNSTNANQIGASDVATVGTIVAAGPVTLDAWYADMQDTFSTYTLGAKSSTTLGGVKLGADARFVSLELDRNLAEAIYFGGVSADQIDTSHNYSSNINVDNSLAKLTLTANAGIFGGKASYGKTGKEGGLTALDNDATTTLLAWGVTANNKADADFYHLQAGVDILPELNFALNYAVVDYTAEDSVTKNANNNVTNWTEKSVEEEEFYGQLTYKMSKNLVSYVRYGVFTQDTSTHNGPKSNPNEKGSTKYDSRADSIDDTRGRIQVAYTF